MCRCLKLCCCKNKNTHTKSKKKKKQQQQQLLQQKRNCVKECMLTAQARRSLVRGLFLEEQNTGFSCHGVVTGICKKMALCRVDWTLFILFILKIAFSTSAESCKRTGTCSCTLTNGSTIDLKAVDGTKSDPSFIGIQGVSGNTFDWNPCTPFSEGTGCKNVMVCQIASEGNFPAGSEDSSFGVDSEGNVVILYGGTKGSDGKTRASSITLKCDPNEPGKGNIPKFSEPTALLYTAMFTSKHACATAGGSSPSSSSPSSSSPSSSGGGLSVGSILLIIFFPLLLLYVVVGVLINRFGRGVDSMPDVLPNHSFWADFPFLVKDGVVFTCGCIKGACSSLYQKCNEDGFAKI